MLINVGKNINKITELFDNTVNNTAKLLIAVI
jgi:hypothetical protein